MANTVTDPHGQRRGHWRRLRYTWRERVIAFLPFAVIAHPMECLLAVAAALAGPPLLVGGPEPASLEALLPSPAVRMWGLALTLAALTTATGLITHRYRTTVATGMRLLAWACTAYAVAVVSAGGWSALAGATLIATIAALSAARAFILTTERVLAVRIRAEASRRDDP